VFRQFVPLQPEKRSGKRKVATPEKRMFAQDFGCCDSSEQGPSQAVEYFLTR
jgi:hypothetical protein